MINSGPRKLYKCPLTISKGELPSLYDTEHDALNCNCNWGTCIAPPTRRPRAHHRVNPYPGAVDRKKRKCFQMTMKRIRRSQQFQLHRKTGQHGIAIVQTRQDKCCN